MFRRVRKDKIPVQIPDMDALFAGRQYQIMGLTNSMETTIFQQSLMRLVYSNYAWEGLSDEESRTIEHLLIQNGRVAAVRSHFDADNKTPEGVYIGLYGGSDGEIQYDFYNRPSAISITGLNGVKLQASTPEDYCVGWDTTAVWYQSQTVSPIMTYIPYLAATCVNALQAWRVAVETRKLGTVFQAPDQREMNLVKSILNRISSNDPWVVLNGSISDEVKVIMRTSNGGSEIESYHLNYLNSLAAIMDLLGLENSNTNKKQTLITAELQYNLTFSRYIAADRLRAREQFAHKLSKLMGKEIRVYNYLKEQMRKDASMDDLSGMDAGIGETQVEDKGRSGKDVLSIAR